MFCSQCGNNVKLNAKFCSNCGSEAESPSAPQHEENKSQSSTTQATDINDDWIAHSRNNTPAVTLGLIDSNFMDKFWGKNIDYYRFKSNALLDIFEINSKREKIHSEELGKTPQEILKKSMGKSFEEFKSLDKFKAINKSRWSKFKEIFNNGGFNIAALVFGPFWAAYRHMYAESAVLLFGYIFIAYFETAFSAFLCLGYQIVFGCVANFLYLHYINRKLKVSTSTAQFLAGGGVSIPAVVGAVIIWVITLYPLVLKETNEERRAGCYSILQKNGSGIDFASCMHKYR